MIKMDKFKIARILLLMMEALFNLIHFILNL